MRWLPPASGVLLTLPPVQYLNRACACTLGWESTFMAKCWWCGEKRKDPCCCHLVGITAATTVGVRGGTAHTGLGSCSVTDFIQRAGSCDGMCATGLWGPSCFTEHSSWPEEARVCQSSCHRWDGCRTHISPRSFGTASCKLPLWAVPELGHRAASLQGQVTALLSLLHFRGWLET